MPETGLFSILDSVDSTNNYAMAAVHAGLASHGMAWFANEQTAGKGQRGRQWQTGKGENIALSIVLQPEKLNPQDQFKISMAVGLACFRFFSGYAGSETSIKWPNDIYWGDRKAGGILIENMVRGNKILFSVVGMGININQQNFDPALQNPVSLSVITGEQYDTVVLAKELYDSVMASTAALSTSDFSIMLETYNNHLFKRHQQVRLRKYNRVFDAVIKGVSSQGKLIVQTSVEEEFDFGLVSWEM